MLLVTITGYLHFFKQYTKMRDENRPLPIKYWRENYDRLSWKQCDRFRTEIDEAHAFSECSVLRFDKPDEAWLNYVSDNRSGNYIGTVPEEEML